ncbi:MAG: alpha/beta hydrolase [Mycobacterium sp.]|uniref:alpha/beta hydrolase fold domain-containing protein n=1 Tax=Mycobacterium sp. TaxID=1785 RepID=UPI001EB13FF9|nr:alpha/beta hydrolase [Mycobacterium sp.]
MTGRFARKQLTHTAIAFGEYCATIPGIGRHLEPVGTIAAVGVWGSRHIPAAIRSISRPRTAPPAPTPPPVAVPETVDVCVSALRGIISDPESVSWPRPQRWAPVLQRGEHRSRYLYQPKVRYGETQGMLLDVWRRPDLPATPAPVLIFVPGGAWVHGSRSYQGNALLSRLAEAGWVCLAIDYRVSPRHRWPRHVMDVKAAVAWARVNAHKFGGDPEFVAIAGCSAGGHLASLAGLTAGDPHFESELAAGTDASVNAVVSIYGRYDWYDRSTPEREGFVDFLQDIVVQRGYYRHSEVYRAASPIERVSGDAPPFLVVHGGADVVIPVAQARDFVGALRGTSRQPVGYLELPGAQHGFDLIDGARTGAACQAIALFLGEMHRRHRLATVSVS